MIFETFTLLSIIHRDENEYANLYTHFWYIFYESIFEMYFLLLT